ncbi:hypothetical protein LTR91_004175 [Friedmanniomyces endolithicus]|uniref:Uncharacterized protein n=1 Tax=Friedmanniomyces endolithicus TaxID=329885 RepID=A0AAN6QZ00_9PEZI|nr:hypothetical protein LTR59_001143 [Friedmanniomyces endolithicus]KAK0821342.1 hypothetical protein LTR75_000816 [Friedmanniomyces endolithicus]KAK0851476.1 hypothetical protein LTR03_003987 [Friedmanniomyces endolithicus]KAK0886204.1 hypothetical protein LTR87_000270 [Friedmanniomyces endolithicus]KAK0916750.1 hypothetical protein LTR02_000520 [Friedmanniomyces endolithicus]
MSVFDPVYRPSRGQHSFLARQQQANRKRKRTDRQLDISDDEDSDTKTRSSPPPEATPRTASTAFHHPVNRTDPHHVAGHSRQAPLPPLPYPHAPLKTREDSISVAEELAALDPPLYVSKAISDDQISSLKRRHADNLTTLLHTCMLRGDWERALRAWGLLLRTEIGGRAVDVRQQGRWGIGAELLLRRDAELPALPTPLAPDQSVVFSFSDAGFKAARDYYERLILQYPHTPRTQQNVNALVFYPALFNIWIYEVQSCARRRRQEIEDEQAVDIESSEHTIQLNTAGAKTIADRKQELEEALHIADRMDELLVSPPYDSSAVLLYLRGMVGLWLADLFAGSSNAPATDDGGSEHSSISNAEEKERDREQALKARGESLMYLKRAKAAGADVPASINALLESQSAIV